MSRLLLVIDVQKDFINENTSKTLSKIKMLVDSKKYDIIAFTRFINDEDSVWYKELNYKGCMTKEQQEIAIDTKNYRYYATRELGFMVSGRNADVSKLFRRIFTGFEKPESDSRIDRLEYYQHIQNGVNDYLNEIGGQSLSDSTEWRGKVV